MPATRLLTVLVLLTTSIRAQEAVTPEGNPILAEARRIAAQARVSAYQHTTEVDEAKGVYKLDCSAFVGLVLKSAAPAALTELPRSYGKKKRPLAADFCDHFLSDANALKSWQRVPLLRDARAGDVLAWRKAEIKPGEDTGHVVVLDTAPIKERDGLFRLQILDSTKTPHADDSRKDGQHGIGRGTIWIAVDDAGAPIGYCWSNPNRPVTRATLSIGRALIQQPAPKEQEVAR